MFEVLRSIGRTRRPERWLACVLAALCLTGVTSVVYAFGVFFEPIRETFDLSSDRVSLIFAINTFVTYTFGIVVGYLADRHASYRLLLLGTACWAGGLILTANAGSYLGVLAWFGLLVAVGFGTAYIVIYATIARWFDRKRGFAMSILSAGFGLGGLVGPPLANVVLSHVSWTTAYVLLAIPTTLVLVATAGAFFLVSSRSGPSGDRSASTAAPDGGRVDGRTEQSFLELFTSVRFLVLSFGFALGFYAFYALLVHLVPYGVEVGISTSTAAIALGLVGGASIPSRLVAGYLSDSYGRISVMMGGYLLMTLAIVGLLGSPDTIRFLAFATLFGIGTGMASALYSPLVADMFGIANVGRMLGLTSVAFGVSGIAGPYVTGLLFEATGSYGYSLLLAVLLTVAGGFLIWLANTDRVEDRSIV